jgi:predicted DCC family thiol-disulfide oxidoreductase YuxK
LRFKTFLSRRGFEVVPLQSNFARAQLNLSPDKLLDEIKLLTNTGQIFGGADALMQIARRVWWAWPIFALTKIPGVTSLFRAAYRRLAANRTCFGDKCLISKNHYHKPN